MACPTHQYVDRRLERLAQKVPQALFQRAQRPDANQVRHFAPQIGV